MQKGGLAERIDRAVSSLKQNRKNIAVTQISVAAIFYCVIRFCHKKLHK